MSVQQPDSLESRIRSSIAEYSRIVQIMHRIALGVEKSTPSFLQDVRTLHDLQSRARSNDRELLAELQKTPSFVTHPLMVERTDLLRRVLELNQALMPKIKGAMVILNDELGTFKNGRVFMTGYRQGGRKHGRIVSCSA